MSDQDKFFFAEARRLAKNSTCLKQQTAAIIVKNGRIIGVGWNLCSPDGFQHGKPVSHCPRLNLATGTDYSLCKSLHAELIALINVGQEDCQGATLYLAGHNYLCWECESFARRFGIVDVRIDSQE